jgi:hypothetical protein
MKIMLAALAVAAACAGLGHAEELQIKTGLTETLGSQHYAGTSLFARFASDGYSLKPAYSQYHDDFSQGTFKTVSVRGAYDADRWGAGLKAGGTPEVNGYSSAFFGVDGSAVLTGDAAKKDSDSPRVEAGGGVTHTSHRDAVDARSRRLPSSVTVGQTDFNAWISGELRSHWLGLDATKSAYSRDLAAVSSRGSRVVMLSGLNETVQGFPNASATLRYEYEGWGAVVPFGSYTRTSFLLAPHSDAVKVGADATRGAFGGGVAYERYAQASFPRRDFFSVSLSAKF